MNISDCIELCFSNLGCVSVGFDDHEEYANEVTEEHLKKLSRAKESAEWKQKELTVNRYISEFKSKKQMELETMKKSLKLELQKRLKAQVNMLANEEAFIIEKHKRKQKKETLTDMKSFIQSNI